MLTILRHFKTPPANSTIGELNTKQRGGFPWQIRVEKNCQDDNSHNEIMSYYILVLINE